MAVIQIAQNRLTGSIRQIGPLASHAVQLFRALLQKLLPRRPGALQQHGDILQLHLLGRLRLAVQHILVFLDGLVEGGELIPVLCQRSLVLLAQVGGDLVLVQVDLQQLCGHLTESGIRLAVCGLSRQLQRVEPLPQVLDLLLRRQEVLRQAVQRVVDGRLAELLPQPPALLKNAVLLKEIG